MKRNLDDSNTESSSNRSLRQFQRDQQRRESGGAAGEEFAAEVAYPAPPASEVQAATHESVGYTVRQPVSMTEDRGDRGEARFRWLGYLALLAAVASLFAFPAFFGSTAALLGFFAFLLGHRALGTWSVIIGLLSLAGYFILVPLYA